MYSASDRTVFSHLAVVWNHVGLTFNSRFSGWEYQMSWSNLVFVVAKHRTDVTQDPCPLLLCRSSTCPLERCWFSGWMVELSWNSRWFEKGMSWNDSYAMQFLVQISRTLLRFLQEKNHPGWLRYFNHGQLGRLSVDIRTIGSQWSHFFNAFISIYFFYIGYFCIFVWIGFAIPKQQAKPSIINHTLENQPESAIGFK